MGSLKQSPVALNMQCAPSVKSLLKGSNGRKSQLNIKCGFFGTRPLKIHKPFAPRVSQVARRNRTRIVVSDSGVAGSYATALAELGESEKILDDISNDLGKLSQFLADKDTDTDTDTDITLYDFLVCPIIPEDEKKEVIESIAKEAKFQPYTLNFLHILIEKKRINLINEIIKEFETAYNKLTNTELAIVSSAVELESRHLAAIAKKIQSFTNAKNVKLKTIIDPSLIAGFTIRFGSRLIDMSVKTRLETLASQMGYTESLELV